MKDEAGKLWIIDFAASNYLPRIIDLAVTACNLCLDTKSKEKTVRNIRMILDEYQKYARLTDYEMEVFPLLYDLANAMGILQISYLSNLGETTDEDMFCEQKGLEFSDGDFWRAVLSS